MLAGLRTGHRLGGERQSRGGEGTHFIPSTSRDLGRLRRLIATDIDLVQSSRSAITVSCASPAHLSRFRRIRVHDTMHTCASLLAALDVHPRVAMAILRHAQIAITMEVYTEVPGEVTCAALKWLGDQLAQR